VTWFSSTVRGGGRPKEKEVWKIPDRGETREVIFTGEKALGCEKNTWGWSMNRVLKKGRKTQQDRGRSLSCEYGGTVIGL